MTLTVKFVERAGDRMVWFGCVEIPAAKPGTPEWSPAGEWAKRLLQPLPVVVGPQPGPGAESPENAGKPPKQ